MKNDKEYKYLISSEEQDYITHNTISKSTFSEFIKNKRKELSNKLDMSISVRNLAERINLEYEMLRKIINKQKPTKKRDCIIAICALLYLNSDETNYALDCYSGMSPLTNTHTRDNKIISFLNANSKNIDNELITLDEINESLEYSGVSMLDIIEHRTKNNSKNIIYPFPLIKSGVRCLANELLPAYYYNNSLIDEYDRFCHVNSFMWLGDGDKCIYELYVDTDGNLSSTKHPGSNYQKYNNINETGVFKECFIELRRIAKAKQREMASIINDTRSYHERCSAKVINNELHVFYETYNYTVPELGEYYLMDYVNGQYTLFVSHKSRFMKYYLSNERYHQIFGITEDIFEEKYNSIDDINKAKESLSYDRLAIINLRLETYQNSKEKIDELISKLKERKAIIQDLPMIYVGNGEVQPEKNVVYKYYKVEKEFQCNFNQDDDIISADLNKANFILSDGANVELTLDDLCGGYQLGLSSIDEVGQFLLKHHTFDILDLL